MCFESSARKMSHAAMPSPPSGRLAAYIMMLTASAMSMCRRVEPLRPGSSTDAWSWFQLDPPHQYDYREREKGHTKALYILGPMSGETVFIGKCDAIFRMPSRRV